MGKRARQESRTSVSTTRARTIINSMKIKYILRFAVIFGLLASTRAADLATTGLSIGPFYANGITNLCKPWINTTGSPIYIRHVYWFMGMQAGGKADFSAWFYRLSDGMNISYRGWDHYQEGSGLSSNNSTDDFGVNDYCVQPGDGVGMGSQAIGYTLIGQGYTWNGKYYQYVYGTWVPDYDWQCQSTVTFAYSTTP